jgi:hypothetical protein
MLSAAKRCWTLLAAVGAFALVSAPALAQTSRAAATCPGQAYSRPFLPWLDLAQYTLVGDGGFESGASGWTLTGGARVVAGNEPWFVRGAGDSRSLYLPAGGTATSPATCIGLLHPTTRFFARSLGLSTLKVDATVHALGLTLVVPIGVVVAGGSFAPTLIPLPLLGNLTTLLSNGTGTVTLKFTALLGPMAVDDVYVDPFKVN